jgi:hypothetical protein
MFQLEPTEHFPIIRQLDDPQLIGTYYVRAYIRKSISKALIATVNLTDEGNYRFSYDYQVPQDAGSGTYIDIETRVFTDSLYTTESDVYGRKVETYLIQSRWNRSFGQGGGTDISYEKIKKIVEEVVSGKYKETNLKPVLDAIGAIEVSPIIKTEKVELGGLARLVEGVRMKVEDLPKPEKPEKINLEPILSAIEEFGKNLAQNIVKEFSTNLEEILKRITETVSSNDDLRAKDKKEILDSVKKMKIIINSSENDRTFDVPEEKPQKIRKLRGRYA